MKGEFGKVCNRTVCQNVNAVWYNSSTRKYYCSECARKINEFSERVDGYTLCKEKQK